MNLIKTIATAARRIAAPVIDAAKALAALARRAIRAIWERHCELMDARPGYRTELIAAASTLLALVDPPAALLTALIAVLGLHAASYGTRTTEAPATWSPPAPKRLYDIDWD